MIENWGKYSNFSKSEFDCKHTGKNDMQPRFMDMLQAIRSECDFPFKITSGFRDVTHPREVTKAAPGNHTKGIAADIACFSDNAWEIASVAMRHGMSVGVSQKAGLPRFIHLDARHGTPVLYSY